MARSLFGTIDPVTKEVIAAGHLFEWLDSQPTRLQFIADIKPEHLTVWRASWKFGDLTASQRWTMTKSFFGFCERQRWIADSPARLLKALKPRKGNRTAPFTDEQYAKILDAVYLYDPENVPELTRKNWKPRLRTFVELMRWSGMALVDAVLFRPEQITDGVLRYSRKKTNERAIVPLPEHVLELLRNVPLEHDSIGPEQPFRSGVVLNSDCANWSRRMKRLFALAGITEVKTEHRTRKPHAHMFRDTFAVWNIVHRVQLHTVSKMLGHSKTATTERAYLPWVKGLEDAYINDARRALDAIAPKKARPGKSGKCT